METQEQTPLDRDQVIRSKRNFVIENLVSLGFALFLVFMIRSSVVEAFKIPSGSMIPTLLVGDHIFVNKMAYGFKVPFSELFGAPYYLYQSEPPARGDIIVFKFPKDESYHYIKRVIGLPGDSIELKNKALFINKIEVARVKTPAEVKSKIFESLEQAKYDANEMDVFYETLGKNRATILLDSGKIIGDTFGPIQVPPGHYFVMGDNRNYSNDSRFWGFVPFKNLRGKAMFIWFSFWWEDKTFRPGRIGTTLHDAADVSSATNAEPNRPIAAPAKP